MSRIISRRALLRRAATAAGLMAAGPVLFRLGAAEPASAPALAAGAKAAAVIQIWLWGGPSHLDTFDPKPAAGRDYAGPLAGQKLLPTGVDGIEISPLLPLLAGQMRRCCLLRGMTHGNNGHETAAYLVQAGRKPAEGLVCPGLGAMVSLFKGSAAGYQGVLPPYITLTRTQGRFSEAGFLPGEHRPFATGGNPAKDPFAVEGIIAEGVTRERQLARRDLLAGLDLFGRAHAGDPAVSALATCRQQAWDLILGDAGRVFDLTQEPAEMRDRYGRNTFGQSCLAARRLVERGVSYITINHQGWDTHKQHFEAMARKLPELDAGLATLISDLADRGLLDRTIVWCGGEFGRTPKVDWAAPWNGGRGHYGKAFSHLVAGGGFRGGSVVGRTDDKGETVVERPIWPWDLMGTFLHLLGIPGDAPLPEPQGRRVLASVLSEGGILAGQTGGILREVIA